MQKIKYQFLLSALIFLIAFLVNSCKEDDTRTLISPTESIELEAESILNPSQYAPLSAKLNVKGNTAFNLEIKVRGKHGSRSDFIISDSSYLNSYQIDVHGLYADHTNVLDLIAKDLDGNEIGRITNTIQTEPLISDLPDVEVLTENLDENHPVFILVNYFGYELEFLPQRPIIVDQFGDIRWYLDFSNSSTLGNIYLDNGLFHMQNNDLVFSGTGTSQVYITDLFGNIKQTISLGEYSFHHQIIEKADGNLLLTANKIGRVTVEDIILEIDPTTGSIVTVWDLVESLDSSRLTLTTNDRDWIHVNGLTHDPSDNTIIISGRTQAMIKLDYNNEVQWIMGVHKGWGTSGNGLDLKQFLLSPLDQQGMPISDQAILDGDANAIDFEWNWYQHSPIILPNGNYMCFDNGLNRNYMPEPLYSRAVEYHIDQENMTVQQVWDFGKEYGADCYSRSVSKVNYTPEVNHVMFASGAITTNGANHGRIIEVNKSNKTVKLDMKVIPPQSYFSITFHNAQRFEFR